MGNWRRPICGVFLVAAALAAIPSAASAEPSGDWGAPPPSVISTLPGYVRSTDLVIDPTGRAIAVWVQGEGIGGPDQIYYATRPPGLNGGWSAPRPLLDQPRVVFPPIELAAAPDGTVTAVWTATVTPGPVQALMQATIKKRAATFSAPTVISRPGDSGDSPRIAVGPKGHTAVVWQRSSGLNEAAVDVFLRPPKGSFSRVKTFSAEGESLQNPEVAVGPKGEILTAWQRVDSESTSQGIQIATRPAGKKAWKGPSNFTSVDAVSPSVGIEPGGRAIVTYSSASAPAGLFERTRPAGSSSFRAQRLVSASNVEIADYELAVGPDGTSALAWAENYPDSLIKASFRYPGASSFSPPRLVSGESPKNDYPSVAVGGARQIFVGFGSSGVNLIPQVAVKPWDSNSFEPPHVLDTSTENLTIDALAAGQDGWAMVGLFHPLSPTESQLDEAAFKTERIGRPNVKWKLNKRSGLLVGTITRPAFRNLRYKVSATRGKATAFGKCRTDYTPKRSRATCKVKLARKGKWKVTVKESQYGLGFDTLTKTVRR